MRDRDIEIGDMNAVDLTDVYAPPSASLNTQPSNESIARITRLKKGMLYSFFSIFIVAFVVTGLVPDIDKHEWIQGLLGIVVVTLWISELTFIFLLNKRINSLFDACFRVFISLVPILALYVLYRSTYDANKAIKLARQAQH